MDRRARLHCPRPNTLSTHEYFTSRLSPRSHKPQTTPKTTPAFKPGQHAVKPGQHAVCKHQLVPWKAPRRWLPHQLAPVPSTSSSTGAMQPAAAAGRWLHCVSCARRLPQALGGSRKHREPADHAMKAQVGSEGELQTLRVPSAGPGRRGPTRAVSSLSHTGSQQRLIQAVSLRTGSVEAGYPAASTPPCNVRTFKSPVG